MTKGRVIAALIVIALSTWVAVMYWQYENDPQTMKQRDQLRAAELRMERERARLDRAQAIITASLKDPASAHFRDVRYIGERDVNSGSFGKKGTQPQMVGITCGWVNAKNSFGGYTGFEPFGIRDDATVISMGQHDFNSQYRYDTEYEPYFKDCFKGWDPPMR